MLLSEIIGSESVTATPPVSIINNITTDADYYPMFNNTTNGDLVTANVANTKLKFNPFTGTLYSTVFNSSSDERLKENIITINNSVELIKQMRGVSFDWISTKQKSFGFIAQEIETILPELVSTDNGMKSINYDATIAILLESIKNLTARIELLEEE